VEKNFSGVSAQVTASGVLVFGQIFPTLNAGNQGRVAYSSKQFARRLPASRAQYTRKPGL